VSIRAELAFSDNRNAEIGRVIVELPIESSAMKLVFAASGIETDKISSATVKSIKSEIDFLEFEDLDLKKIEANELNYFVKKLSALGEDDLDKLNAILESGRHRENSSNGGKLADIINIIENLDCFKFHNGFDEQGYGEFLLSGAGNVVDKIKRQLEHSSSSTGWEYANVVEYLRDCADAEEFGRAMAQENDGEFISDGYLIENEGFKSIYYGAHEIPNDYRLFGIDEPLARSLVKVENTNLSALLLEMHAVCGDNYMRDAKYNIGTLVNGGDDFFILDNGGALVLSSAELLYRKNTFEHNYWLSLSETADFKAYFLSVTDRNDGQIIGNIFETEFQPMRESIQKLGISFTHVNAEMKDGTSRTFKLKEWNAMDAAEKAELKNYEHEYAPVDKGQIFSLIGTMRRIAGDMCAGTSSGAFLHRINESYMNEAHHKKPGFIRVSPDAARELLAQSATDVHRLKSGGIEKMLPIEAVKIGLRQVSDREFAVKLCDLEGLEKWAQRSAKDMVRQTEREEQKKLRDETL